MNECLLGFNGERHDPVSGSTHLGNGYRAYNAVLMRFNCPDFMSPFGAGGINTYAYCMGDPVNQDDPSGHHSVGGWLGILTGVLLGGILAPFSGGSSLAVCLSAATVMVSTGLAVTQQFVEKSDPQAGTVLGWAALAVGVIGELTANVAGQMLAPRLYRAMTFLGKLQKINGRFGLPMSGEFRNARFLGRNLTEGQISWNIRFEDSVPLGRRLTIMMSSHWEGGVLRGENEIWENDHWIMQIYRAPDIKNIVLSPDEDFAVYRLAMADSGVNQRSMGASYTGYFRKLMDIRRPGIGYRGAPVAEGPVSEILAQNYAMLSGMERAGFGHLWGPDSAQYFLNGISERYGNIEGSMVLRGESRVFPSSDRYHQNILNWQ